MVDDELQIREGRGEIVDIAHIEGIAAERVDGRALVDVDDVDAERTALLHIAADPGLGQRIALRIALPFGRVDLDAAEFPAGVVLLELIEPALAVARIEAAGENDLVGIGLLECGALLGRVEALPIELEQIGRQQDRLIAITVDEQVLACLGNAVVEKLVPVPAFARRREAGMAVPEDLDESQAVAVAAVLRSRVPEVGVAVDDEDLLAVRRDIHEALLPARRCCAAELTRRKPRTHRYCQGTGRQFRSVAESAAPKGPTN